MLTTKKNTLSPDYYLHIYSTLQLTVGFKNFFCRQLLKNVDLTLYESNYSTFHAVSEIINRYPLTIQVLLKNTKASYRSIYSNIIANIQYHYNDNHLVDIIIEYAFGKYKPVLTNPQIFFLYNAHILNQWYEKDNIQHFNYDISHDSYNYSDNLTTNLKTIMKKKYQFVFHATNWSSALKILNKGPDHNKGRECLDFGVEPSFYMTPQINTALEWATNKSHMWYNEGAILIFALQDNMFKKKGNKYFMTASNEWETLTTSSRKCQENILDTYNFVYGPMVANPYKIENFNEKAKAHTDIKWQFASKNSISDSILKKIIYGIIWLKKE